MARTRARRPGGWQRGHEPQARALRSLPTALGRVGGRSVNSLIDDLVRPPPMSPAPSVPSPRAISANPWSWTSTARLEGRVFAFRKIRQHDDRTAFGLHLGGHARSPRSRYRRQARRPGPGKRRFRGLEGTYRMSTRWRAILRAGTQHRRRDDRRGQRRSLEKNHCRRRGEILQLKEAINTMVDQLRPFASEVTRVAREVGTEGKLGGQASCRASAAHGRT